LILVAEPSVSVAAALRKYLEGAGFELVVVGHLDEAISRARDEAVELVFAAASLVFDGEKLCEKLKAQVPALPVVLYYPPEVDNPDEAAAHAGADGYLVGPIKRGTIVSTARTMLRMQKLRTTVERLEADLRKHVAEPPRDASHIEGSSADFEFFKRFILMEVKRSRRYKLHVSFLVVAIDHFHERLVGSTQGLRMAVMAEALGIIAGGVRDIDLAVPFSENRFLIFLPHTSRGGALVVAGRLHERIAKMKTVQSMTASVGVASYDPGASTAEVSFGSLMKEATELLRQAQLQGGDRVVASAEAAKAKKSRIVMS
jgi:diguanylate cyclase (GGDEF)-like protein